MSKCFVVLSMHRSASSFVSQALCRYADWEVDDVNPGYGQPTGNYEHRGMRKLNDDILAAAGGSWRRLPGHEKVMALKGKFDSRIKKVLAELRAERKMWGWKDPRSAFTLELMVPFITNLHLVAVFRDPEQTAQSMFVRDQNRYGMGYVEACELTRRYNKKIINLVTRYTLKGGI